MKIEIFIEDDHATILKEQPELIREIEKSATLVLMNAAAKALQARTYLDLDTHNGHLVDTTGNPDAPKVAERDELQTMVEKDRRNDKDLTRNLEVEGLLRTRNE